MIIVQKFGGTSVGTIERIKSVAKIIIKNIQDGHIVVPVVSAMSGATNNLLYLSNQISDVNSADKLREQDAIISTGEVVSAALLAMALQSMGYKAKSIQAWQLPISTTPNHSDADITNIDTTTVIDALECGVIPVICGFQGVCDGSITTLGRGGSDTTAAAIAGAMKADLCDIYTDVDGIYTADPNKIGGARFIPQLSYDEAISMASSGSKVLHSKAAQIAKRDKLKMRILSTFNPEGKYTTISAESHEYKMAAISVMTHRELIAQNEDMPLSAKIYSAENDNTKFISVPLRDNSGRGHISEITVTRIGDVNHDEIVAKCLQIVQDRDMKIEAYAIGENDFSICVQSDAQTIAQALHNALIV